MYQIFDIQIANEISWNTNPVHINNKFGTTTRKSKPRNPSLEVSPGWQPAKQWTKEYSEAERGGLEFVLGRPKGVGVKYGQSLQVGAWIDLIIWTPAKN